jgi:hypothetical protein
VDELYIITTQGDNKMNKKILFVSIFAVFLLIMIPTVSAFEYNTSLKGKNLEFDKVKNKVFNVNILKFRKSLRSIAADELNDRIINKIDNSLLSESEKILLKDALATINISKLLIQGIIIPTFLYFMVHIAINELSIFLGLLILIIIGLAVPTLFINPIAEELSENIEISSSVISLSLTFTSIVLAAILSITLYS